MGAFFFLRQRRIVDEDGEDLDAVHLVCEDDAVVDRPWRLGVRFTTPLPQPIVLRPEDEVEDEPVYRDYLDGPIPLVSRRLHDALLAAGASNLEFHETALAGGAALPGWPGYVAMNVVGLVEVADDGASESQRAFGTKGADLFDRLVTRADLEPQLAIFRMAEQLATLVVSQAVRDACLAAGIDTLDFAPLPPPAAR